MSAPPINSTATPAPASKLLNSSGVFRGGDCVMNPTLTPVLPRAVPELAIGRRQWVPRARFWFGRPDTPVANPRFHPQFVVEGPDVEFVRHVLTPQLCDWLMDDPRSRHYPLRFLGEWLGSALPGRCDLHDARSPRDFLLDVSQRLSVDLR